MLYVDDLIDAFLIDAFLIDAFLIARAPLDTLSDHAFNIGGGPENTLRMLELLHEHGVRDLLLFQSMQRGEETVLPLEPDCPFEETGIFQAPGFPQLAFIEHAHSHDPTNGWVPNRACVEAMLRSAGFEILDRPEAEVYLCRRLFQPETLAVYPARPMPGNAGNDVR